MGGRFWYVLGSWAVRSRVASTRSKVGSIATLLTTPLI